jgi:hypothetical protein
VSNWAMWSSGWASCFPTFTGSCTGSTCSGTRRDRVSIRGTFLGPFETPAGVIQPTGAKVEFPTADFWYLRNGKVEVFDCHIAFTTLFAQLGILPDYASAVAASAPER